MAGATPEDANCGNLRTTSGVKQDDMDATPIPNAATSPSRVRNIRCAAPQVPVWEYKIGIAPANTPADEKNVQELFLKVLGKHGWIFVSENHGIFHFKRPKR
jgi:hypothetical protein